ncbi:type III PLP-dependent enzyme domain-containing protein [Streptomyces rubiginosohelvolus]|uniref:type III PLP-dependent enzyme n=1 Tax=Streptomyces rubiginosohelvolus TaxID=67362 RepID=UPI00366A32D2
MSDKLLVGLVRAYGSPLYVYDLGALDAAAAALRAALPAPSTLYYSLKANPHPQIARALRLAGCHAEISSEGELTAALEAGFDGSQCLYTGPGKTTRETNAALRAGVRRFSVESATDYRRVAACAQAHDVSVTCLLRLNADSPEGASGLRMTGTPSQFGLDSAALLAAPEEFAPLPGARIAGTHFFAMSNARNPEDLLASLTASITEAARVHRATGIAPEVVDLGGGFAAPYAAAGERLDYAALREPLEEALDAHLPGWRSGAPVIAFESGRYLAGGCGQLVCTVSDVKQSRDRGYVVLDTGIHHLGGLAGLGRLLPMQAAALTLRPEEQRSGHDDGDVAPPQRVSLVGPLCTPADVLSRTSDLGPSSEGDLLGVANVGAYGLTASLLGFLSRPAAAEIVLRADDVVEASRLVLHRTPLTPSPQDT